MVSSAKALPAVAAFLATAALVGCGSAHASHPGGQRPTGTTVVSIPRLGSLSYRCFGARRFDAMFSPRGAPATESVTVEGDNRRHLRAATLNPGPTGLSVAPGAYRTLTWRVIQSTEPSTVEATVRLSFFSGVDRYCSLAHWTSAVNVIGHQGPWSLPKAWP